MEIKTAKYEITAMGKEQYPLSGLPEIALVGRSNVGKSSLINTMLNRNNLARESVTPGKTRGINFYKVNERCYFVDLPGYGYAKVSKTEKASWQEMIETYLSSRTQLKFIMMLVDSRHAPTKDDQMMVDWLKDRECPSLVIATKLDKLKRNQIKQQLKEIYKILRISEELVIPFSTVTKEGRKELWDRICPYIC